MLEQPSFARRQRAIAVRCCWLLVAGIVISWASASQAVPTIEVEEITRFTGTTYGDPGTTLTAPPDTMGAMGPFDYAELINTSFAYYDKSGILQEPRITHKQFWDKAFLNTTNAPSGIPVPLHTADSPFDPRIIYDFATSRWYAIAVDHRKSAQSSIYVAVTMGTNPSVSILGNWRGFKILADEDGKHWADFPTLGKSSDGLFIGAKMFDVEGDGDTVDFQTHLTGIPLASLNAAQPNILDYRKVEDADDTNTALQPAFDLPHNTQTGTPYRAFTTVNGSVQSVRIPSDFFTGGAMGQLKSVGVGGAGPKNVPYHDDFGGLAPIDVDQNVVEMDSNVVLMAGTYWGVTNVVSGTTGNNALRWFAVDADTGNLTATGLIDSPDFHRFYPSIAVNPYGKIVIGAKLDVGRGVYGCVGARSRCPGVWRRHRVRWHGHHE